ncbi:hypothetical protein HYH02_001192 [Chlamydomonas schloesseri]|uniref:Uncharacterized protein n=1 Tax=Chlamydomonas schloesseri TaxID=2026947 RepID=A0A835WX10_9CHLO|nr:hypothetical protein HYH02_001192 [Chlamydomonas schloesseri]|eukprot:KAG2454156.1 hypothetical protein HYH02_001192 [Chlamydomonas schloesseri]
MESGIVLHELDKVGCGAAYGKVAMLAVHLLKPLPNMRDRHLTELVKERTTWRLQGRMATEEIYTNVASGTDLSFDYVAFTVVAAVIAGIGLATNNTVMIVASMLVSPLMGPILAISFGTSVKDWYLLSKGMLAEVVGVAVTFVTGLVIGFICCAWTNPSNAYEWPTVEMASRGEVSNLLVGFFFAVPSGAGVALSTTQGGANALVGVAIAASLLPPVTNTGICLAYAMAGAFRTGRNPGQFAYIGGISFCLFLINVVSIYAVCIFLFWVKRVHGVRKQLIRYKDMPAIDPETGCTGQLLQPLKGGPHEPHLPAHKPIATGHHTLTHRTAPHHATPTAHHGPHITPMEGGMAAAAVAAAHSDAQHEAASFTMAAVGMAAFAAASMQRQAADYKAVELTARAGGTGTEAMEPGHVVIQMDGSGAQPATSHPLTDALSRASVTATHAASAVAATAGAAAAVMGGALSSATQQTVREDPTFGPKPTIMGGGGVGSGVGGKTPAMSNTSAASAPAASGRAGGSVSRRGGQGRTISGSSRGSAASGTSGTAGGSYYVDSMSKLHGLLRTLTQQSGRLASSATGRSRPGSGSKRGGHSASSSSNNNNKNNNHNKSDAAGEPPQRSGRSVARRGWAKVQRLVLVDTAAIHAAALQLEQEQVVAEARAAAAAQRRATNPVARSAAEAEEREEEREAKEREGEQVGSDDEGWEEVPQDGADGPLHHLGEPLEDVEEGDEAAAAEPAPQSGVAGEAGAAGEASARRRR